MGGEGSMMQANNSLKNNRSLLSKRRDKDALEGSYANIELKDFPKATEAQLKAIKEKTINENRERRIKYFIAWIIFIGLLLLGIALI